jgi:hypothetical protein
MPFTSVMSYDETLMQTMGSSMVGDLAVVKNKMGKIMQLILILKPWT